MATVAAGVTHIWINGLNDLIKRKTFIPAYLFSLLIWIMASLPGEELRNPDVTRKPVAQTYPFRPVHALSRIWPAQPSFMPGVLSRVRRGNSHGEGGFPCMRLWHFHRSVSGNSPLAELWVRRFFLECGWGFIFSDAGKGCKVVGI